MERFRYESRVVCERQSAIAHVYFYSDTIEPIGTCPRVQPRHCHHKSEFGFTLRADVTNASSSAPITGGCHDIANPKRNTSTTVMVTRHILPERYQQQEVVSFRSTAQHQDKREVVENGCSKSQIVTSVYPRAQPRDRASPLLAKWVVSVGQA